MDLKFPHQETACLSYFHQLSARLQYVYVSDDFITRFILIIVLSNYNIHRCQKCIASVLINELQQLLAYKFTFTTNFTVISQFVHANSVTFTSSNTLQAIWFHRTVEVCTLRLVYWPSNLTQGSHFAVLIKFSDFSRQYTHRPRCTRE